MAYGVDECRRCGKPMQPSDPEALTRYKAAATRKPTMTPQQWRAAGWKAAPTPHQIHRPLDGVCFMCKPEVRGKYAKYPARPVFIGMAGLIVFLAASVWYLSVYGW